MPKNKRVNMNARLNFSENDECPTCEQSITDATKETTVHRTSKVGELTDAISDVERMESKNKTDSNSS